MLLAPFVARVKSSDPSFSSRAFLDRLLLAAEGFPAGPKHLRAAVFLFRALERKSAKQENCRNENSKSYMNHYPAPDFLKLTDTSSPNRTGVPSSGRKSHPWASNRLARSAGAIFLYRLAGSERLYLLLLQGEYHWPLWNCDRIS